MYFNPLHPSYPFLLPSVFLLILSETIPFLHSYHIIILIINILGFDSTEEQNHVAFGSLSLIYLTYAFFSEYFS
jgi:hypothetical protein